MKISELIRQLEILRARHGDIPMTLRVGGKTQIITRVGLNADADEITQRGNELVDFMHHMCEIENP